MQDIPRDTLERAAQGDLKAFEQIYQAASSFVYNVALRITRNSADAEEVAQDVFMKIHSNLKYFQFRSSFKTWVYRIAANTAINRYHRSLGEIKGRVDYDGIAESLSSGNSTAAGAIQKDAQARLDSLMAVLSPEHKACLVLREIEGLSYLEIAQALKIPINTVRSRLKRARLALLVESRKGLIKDAV